MPLIANTALRSAVLVTAACAAAIGPRHDAQAQAVYDTRALTGELAPGTGAGVVFSGLHGHSAIAPALNADGDIVFRGQLAGLGVDSSNGVGVWSDASGTNLLVAREGDPAPGTDPASVFTGFSGPYLNSAGQVAILGGAGAGGGGIWSERTGVLGLTVRSGDPAPVGGAGVNLGSINGFVYNDAGQTGFRGYLSGPGIHNDNSDGIWLQTDGVVSVVAREGNAAPGTGVVFSHMSTPIMNGSGDIAFQARVNGGGINEFNNETLWLHTGGALTLVARGGQAAPGAGPGVAFMRLYALSGINDAAQLAFHATLTGAGVDDHNDSGIWAQLSGAPELVARAGDAAPGTGPGVVFDGFNNPFLNAAGQVAFEATLDGTGVDDTNDRGMWSQGSGSLELIARSGSNAPGTDTGVLFRAFSSPVFNNAGQTAFFADLEGTGVDFTNDEGIWATNLAGQLTLVARSGDTFDIDDDPLTEDLRTISAVMLTTGSGGEDGRRTSLNDAGQLAFSLRFTDGSEGVFVATILDILLGDVTGDGFVGAQDLDVLLANWGETVTPGTTAAGDLSGDGVVGQADLDIVLGAWGDGTPAGSTIPEPGSLAWLALGTTVLMKRRRSTRLK
ncbi:hypothetical protein OT109_18730 [Phycisphaeraceae bacterium D3-23]